MTARAVFLDRDGVINRVDVIGGLPRSPQHLEDFEILPDVPEALVRLRAAGYRLVVVTNQPDVARGKQTRDTIETMHAALRQRVAVDDIRVCYHDDADRCSCRKPAAGLLLEAAHEWGLDLAASFIVGDRWRDIGAGRRAGCRTILIDAGYSEAMPDAPDVRVRSLAEAADWILKLGRAEEDG